MQAELDQVDGRSIIGPERRLECLIAGLWNAPKDEILSRMSRKFGISFSWKRALGLSAAKGRLSKQLGIPLTRTGRQRKLGRAMGCCVLLVAIIGGLAALLFMVATLS